MTVDAAKKPRQAGRKPCQHPYPLLKEQSFMFRFPIALLASVLCASCVAHRPIQDSTSPPIDAANPLDGTPVAIAWSSATQLMMGVDTGAVQPSLLFSPAVESIGSRLRGRGAMRVANVPISLKQGEEPLSRKQDVVMVDQAPYDGLLGWDCIKKYVWNINYPKRSHRFFNKLPAGIRGWHKLPLIPGSDYPQIADKHGRRIILDTGAPHAVYISKKRWNAIKQAYPDAFVSVYSGYSPAAGGFYAHECMHVSSFQLGPLELKNILLCESFANPEVMGIPNDIDIILGYGALVSRQFWLDGPGNALYFSSNSYKVPGPTSFNLMGGTFIQDRNGNGPMKAFVAEWSPAWNAGLRTGDVLVSINGRKNPYPDLVEYVTTQRGAKASVVVLRRNKPMHIQWEVPAAPPAGDYHPTPQAITEQEFETHVKQQEEKEQTSPSQEDPQQKAAAPSGTPEESPAATEGKTGDAPKS